MRGIDKEAVKNRYNVIIAQKYQRVCGVEAVEKCEKDRDKVERSLRVNMSIVYSPKKNK